MGLPLLGALLAAAAVVLCARPDLAGARNDGLAVAAAGGGAPANDLVRLNHELVCCRRLRPTLVPSACTASTVDAGSQHA